WPALNPLHVRFCHPISEQHVPRIQEQALIREFLSFGAGKLLLWIIQTKEKELRNTDPIELAPKKPLLKRRQRVQVDLPASYCFVQHKSKCIDQSACNLIKSQSKTGR